MKQRKQTIPRKGKYSPVGPKCILVTGCAGFIGSNFVAEFVRRFPKARIVGIDDLSSGRIERVHGSVLFHELSILEREKIDALFSKHRPEFVFHFAAIPRVSYSVEHPFETADVNILGTIALLASAHAHGARRFIFSSSSSVYGGAKILPTKEGDNAPNPRSPYALQKYVGELQCALFSRLYGLDTVSLRYFNVFGPEQSGDSAYSTVIAAWLEALFFPGKTAGFIEGTGTQSRDFCYVDNVVEANMLAMQAPQKIDGGVFNIGHGERTSLLEVKKLIEKYTGKELDLQKRKPRTGDVRHTHADISKAQKHLGYAPRIDFAEGLRRTVEWHQKRSGGAGR